MYKQITYLTDSIGSKYIGIKFNKEEIEDLIYLWSSEFDMNKEKDKVFFFNLIKNRLKRDGDEYHITIINVREMSLIKNIDKKELSKIIINDIKFRGIGKALKDLNTAYFIVLDSEMILNLRLEYGLPPSDLHITLGFDKKDVHGVHKGIESIIKLID